MHLPLPMLGRSLIARREMPRLYGNFPRIRNILRADDIRPYDQA